MPVPPRTAPASVDALSHDHAHDEEYEDGMRQASAAVTTQQQLPTPTQASLIIPVDALATTPHANMDHVTSSHSHVGTHNRAAIDSGVEPPPAEHHEDSDDDGDFVHIDAQDAVDDGLSPIAPCIPRD